MSLRALLTIPMIAAACGPERFAPDTTQGQSPDTRIESTEGLPGSPCDDAGLMVRVSSASSSFCIDRFEASVSAESLGSPHQGGGDDTVMTTDGTTDARAEVALGVLPATGLTWYQAKAACQNAGKRLCTLTEWELACRGPAAHVYPYGSQIDDQACNGFFHYAEVNPLPTGSLDTCGSAFGVYDMSGNVEEWVDTAVARFPGESALRDRAVRGGSFQSNSNALSCSGPEFHEPPDAGDNDRGFRCCL